MTARTSTKTTAMPTGSGRPLARLDPREARAPRRGLEGGAQLRGTVGLLGGAGGGLARGVAVDRAGVLRAHAVGAAGAVAVPAAVAP
ncbi:MAG: hypothetical protein B7Y93_09480 [Micrococcales bacterium 32-70-13]|nr:MAG: hypothetical protein B7Y93_09480 [Micrococcales bacterium 32-70-13]